MNFSITLFVASRGETDALFAHLDVDPDGLTEMQAAADQERAGPKEVEQIGRH